MLSVKIRRELSGKRGAEMLFVDMFGHDVQQPLPGRDFNRTLHRPFLTFVIRDVTGKCVPRRQISSSANENSCSIRVH